MRNGMPRLAPRLAQGCWHAQVAVLGCQACPGWTLEATLSKYNHLSPFNPIHSPPTHQENQEE